jgi:hypothetical protein
MTERRIREIVRDEIYSNEYTRRNSSLLGDSYILKRDLKQFCELKIENEVGKKLDFQRGHIFETLRNMSKNDPIIVKNIEDISKNFSVIFAKHCDVEILQAKKSITSYLQSEVTRISDTAPYQHISSQMREENKRDIQALETRTNWLVGSMALINIGIVAYMSSK